MPNKLMIAVAGSGKTQYIVQEATRICNENPKANILITTYTNNNENEIRERFFKLNNRFHSNNITIQPWFSFLLQHGCKPYKYSFMQEDYDIKGILFVNEPSAIRFYDEKKKIAVPWSEEEIKKHYFTSDNRIYTDKISKFVIRCNERSKGSVIERLSKIYTHIFIDEVQDLAGYDLELIKLLLQSKIKIIMVGDPRQTVYNTHHATKYPKYSNGNVKDFIEQECNTKRNRMCEIDEETLNKSHRNAQVICDFSSRLYPTLKKAISCSCCSNNNEHLGVWLVKSSNIKDYVLKYNPIELRFNEKTRTENLSKTYNFGISKGKTFDRVLIYPTKKDFLPFIKDGTVLFKETTKAKYYVAFTRAKYSIGIVFDKDIKNHIPEISYWFP